MVKTNLHILLFATLVSVSACVLADEEIEGLTEELAVEEVDFQDPNEGVILKNLDSEDSLALETDADFGIAGPIGSCKYLRSFVLEFRTGGDDLRNNSEVIVWLTTTSGDVELQHVWGPFGGNSTNSRSVTFLNPNWSVNACTVTGVRVRMVSHPAWYETPDNWNMDGFTIYGYNSSGLYSYLLSAFGMPLHRFTNSSQWWSLAG